MGADDPVRSFCSSQLNNAFYIATRKRVVVGEELLPDDIGAAAHRCFYKAIRVADRTTGKNWNRVKVSNFHRLPIKLQPPLGNRLRLANDRRLVVAVGRSSNHFQNGFDGRLVYLLTTGDTTTSARAREPIGSRNKPRGSKYPYPKGLVASIKTTSRSL